MNFRCFGPRCVLAVLVLAFGWPFAAHAQAVPGRVKGNILFRNPSAELISQCSSDPAVSVAGDHPVYLRSVATNLIAAEGDYSLSNTVSGTDFRAATYDLGPGVTDTDNRFSVLTEHLRFASGASYRFGARYAFDVGARVCPAVHPVSTNAGGTNCDQSECAVLLDVQVHLTGDPWALAGLDSSSTAACSVVTIIEDFSGAGIQAGSPTHSFAVSDLVAGYQTIPVIVRGNATQVFSLLCNVPILPGESGYATSLGLSRVTVGLLKNIDEPCANTGTPTAPIDLPADLIVTRAPAPTQELALQAVRGGIPVLEIYRPTSPAAALAQTVSVGKPFQYAFSPDGKRVAIATRDGATGVVDISGGALSLALASANTFGTMLKPGHLVAWHPTANVYAVLGRARAATPTPIVKIYRANSSGPPTLLQADPLPILSGMDLARLQLTAMAYSDDGTRLVVAGSGPTTVSFLTIVLSAAVSTDGLVAGTFVTATPPPVAAAYREEVHDIAFDGPNTEISTDRRVYAVNGTTLVPGYPRLNYDSAFGLSAKRLVLTEDVPGGNRMRLVMVDLATLSAIPGPTYGYGSPKGEVAMSSDGKHVAGIAAGQLLIFNDAPALVSRLADATVSGIRFRPGTW